MSSFYSPQQFNQFAQPTGGFARPMPSRPFASPPMPTGNMMGFSGAQNSMPFPVLPPQVQPGFNPEPTGSPGPGMAYDSPAETSPPPPPAPPSGGGNQGTNTGQTMTGVRALNPQDIDLSRFGGGIISPAMQSAAVQMGMISPGALNLLAGIRNTGGPRGDFARRMQRQFAEMDRRNRLRQRQRAAGFRSPLVGSIIYD